MDPILKDALIRFARLVITAAVVAGAQAVLGVDLNDSPQIIIKSIGSAVVVAIIHAGMEYLRTFLGAQNVVSTKPTAGALQARNKTALDYFPI